ncbi:uncharacterized protein GLRG_07999 [Colletotrichum graminicola M1.001]|uniref:Uncharacterized protein n=1 Tax=Colletotrichum graminicola (strain M1.001 / M2 / FGSC 10212) TaxID=645133 RepID=E3QPS8_COLGM|nr:uncharacterized protein GLRG_07999 [Colletotrichum graminicola M1.001]EFQ32855.1 hypothetical protein GLRG_07999 [Colletotrichum graminicola M1.001]
MESGTRSLTPPPVTTRQRDMQAWVYKPLRANPWTITIFISILLVFICVPFGCTLAFLSTQRSLPFAWATLVAFSATVLALLSLLGTLRWWHQARPHLPKLPINQNGCCSDVSDFALRGALGSNAADTPAKNRFIITCISYQIVRVADMIFGHRVPPHLIACAPFDELAVDQQNGSNVYAVRVFRTAMIPRRSHPLAPTQERGRTGMSNVGTTMLTMFP